MRLSCHRYKPCKSYSNFYENKLKLKSNPTLATDRSLFKNYVVNKNTTNFSPYHLIRGTKLPEQIFIGIVDQDAYSGSEKNQFNFKHCNIEEVSLVVNG